MLPNLYYFVAAALILGQVAGFVLTLMTRNALLNLKEELRKEFVTENVCKERNGGHNTRLELLEHKGA